VESRRRPPPAAIAGRLRERQAAAIRDALNRLPSAEQPVVTGSVVMADPATALASAAADADLVVIGYGADIPGKLKVRLEDWPRPYGGHAPRDPSTVHEGHTPRDPQPGRIPELTSR
jgi:hypothetical protein